MIVSCGSISMVGHGHMHVFCYGGCGNVFGVFGQMKF